MSKTEKKLRENAMQAVNNGKLIKPLTSEDFDDQGKFADYKLIADGLQGYIYNQACNGKAPKGASLASYAKAICKALELNATNTDKVVKKLTTTRTVVAGKNSREMTAESKIELRRYNDAIKRIDAKEISAQYTYEQKQKDLKVKIQERETWRKEKATYTIPLFSQKKDGSFRKDLESCIAYTLIDQNDSADWKNAKQRADANAWSRWIAKAKELKIDYEPFKNSIDLDGLKIAVRAAFEKHNQEILDKALASASK